MDSRYTNREKYLDGLSNEELAFMIERACFCDECPVAIKNDGDYHDCLDEEENCVTKISKWLGGYADD